GDVLAVDGRRGGGGRDVGTRAGRRRGRGSGRTGRVARDPLDVEVDGVALHRGDRDLDVERLATVRRLADDRLADLALQIGRAVRGVGTELGLDLLLDAVVRGDLA